MPDKSKRGENSNKQNSTNRRKLLKVVGAGSISVAGFSNFVDGRVTGRSTDLSREELLHRSEKAFNAIKGERDIEFAIQEHAGELLENLSDNGLLERTAVPNLLSNQLTLDDVAAGKEGVFVGGIAPRGKSVTHIQLNKQVSKSKRLVVVVLPQQSRSYALVKPTGDGVRTSNPRDFLIYEPSLQTGGKQATSGTELTVEPQCHVGTQCNIGFTPGGGGCQLLEIRCCNGNCFQDVIGSCSECTEIITCTNTDICS